MRTLILCLLSIFFVNNVHAWQIQDPKNDDRGVGTVVYPTSNMYKKGELDITEVGLETANDGYWMNIKFAKPIQAPKKQVDPISGEPLDNFYRHKFFNFLVDIYIKSDKGF
ncbi:MAG: glucodextranase DOMON-like domain-containing protein, partial [Pseudomonadota bacterium]